MTRPLPHNQPTSRWQPPRVQAAIDSSVHRHMDWHLYQIRTPEQIEPLLRICLDCQKHLCTKQYIWLKRLACVGFRECERWGKTMRG